MDTIPNKNPPGDTNTEGIEGVVSEKTYLVMSNLVGACGRRQPQQRDESQLLRPKGRHRRREQLEMQALSHGADATLAQLAADAWLEAIAAHLTGADR